MNASIFLIFEVFQKNTELKRQNPQLTYQKQTLQGQHIVQ